MNKIVRHAYDDKTLERLRRTPQALARHDSQVSLNGAAMGGLTDNVP